MDEEHLGDQTFRQWIEAPPDSLEDDGVHPEEKRRLVREVIDELPTRSREILILAYFHRFGYQEIGQIVGIPMGTVKSRLNYAIRRFSVRYRAALLNRREEKP
jgi:RNA polymerase sigma-70 factor (ECF subfamily)